MMAHLQKDYDKQSWLRWSIELLRRGLWARDMITVHGPHPGAPYMWGEAEVSFDKAPGVCDERLFGTEVEFRTASNIRGFDDLRGLRVYDKEDRDTYPLLALTRLTPKARRQLKAYRKQLTQLDREA
jgi:hypothetical protein